MNPKIVIPVRRPDGVRGFLPVDAASIMAVMDTPDEAGCCTVTLLDAKTGNEFEVQATCASRIIATDIYEASRYGR
ncbi:hypothetical protein [Roseicella sp. DB1501]|uniref:hypothetical protein n=1 Tax=Roseicella sp. DB1501 TaxID=2730925 RepID=UPI001491DAC5|nr:hypothetical protein [Roseicella sp. DB1501]NOG69798.1 hypothetical protein [Roseicella sp. DB1501]